MLKIRLLLFAFFIGAAYADIPAQLPKALVVGLDHIPVVVTDLEKAEADFRALGFAIKPGRSHADGIRNAHVKFTDGTEIELITAPAAVDALTSEYRAKMGMGEGPVYFGLYSTDHAALRAKLSVLGMPLQFEEGLITFPPTSPLHPLFFGGRNKAASDRPEYFAHKNSAARLSALWVRDDPELRRMLAGLGVALAPAGSCGAMDVAPTWHATLPEGDLYLVHSDTANVVAARVEVRRLGDVVAILQAAGIEPKKDPACVDGGLWIPPSRAHGIWLEFVDPRSPPIPTRNH